jgi:hypothetical protein
MLKLHFQPITPRGYTPFSQYHAQRYCSEATTFPLQQSDRELLISLAYILFVASILLDHHRVSNIHLYLLTPLGQHIACACRAQFLLNRPGYLIECNV